MEEPLKLFCRLCAEEKLEKQLVVMNTAKIKLLFSPTFYQRNSLLPSRICSSCSTKVDYCCDFFDIVNASSVKLEDMLTVLKCHLEKNGNNLEFLPRECDYLSIPVDPVVELNTLSKSVCPHCQTGSFTSKNALRTHVRSCHPSEATGRRYGCHICTQNFVSAADRSVHESIHVGENPFLCEHCGKVFNHANNLRIHLNTHSNCRKKFLCEICQKSFLTRNFLQEHQNMHMGNKPHACDICGKKFHGKGHLRQHKWTHAGRSFHCSFCGLAFTRKSNMSVHMREFHLKTKLVKDEKILEVDTAKTVCFGQEKPDASPKENNSNRSFSCKRCKMTFNDYLTLKQHYSVHMDVTECNICGKKFKHHGSLTYHRRVTHTGDRPFKCSYCDERFALKSVATIHERRVHTLATPFKCTNPDCERSFHSAGALRTHIRTHSDLQPFTCEICGKSFRWKNSLMLHLKGHNGDHKYRCTVCGRTFLQKANLSRHEKKHGPDSRPFFCKFCGESFAKKSDSGKHANCRLKLLESSDTTEIGSAEKMLDLVALSRLAYRE